MRPREDVALADEPREREEERSRARRAFARWRAALAFRRVGGFVFVFAFALFILSNSAASARLRASKEGRDARVAHRAQVRGHERGVALRSVAGGRSVARVDRVEGLGGDARVGEAGDRDEQEVVDRAKERRGGLGVVELGPAQGLRGEPGGGTTRAPGRGVPAEAEGLNRLKLISCTAAVATAAGKALGIRINLHTII